MKDESSGGLETGKKDLLFNLISQQPDTEKFIYILKTHTNQNISF